MDEGAVNGMDARLVHFVDEVSQHFAFDTPETFWQCEIQLKRLVANGFIADALNGELAKLIQNPLHLGDWHAQQVVIHRAPDWSLAIAIFDSQRQYLHTSSFLGMYVPIGQSALHYQSYQLPKGFDDAVYNPALSLSVAEAGQVLPGEVFQMRALTHVYDFQIDKPVVIVKFVSRFMRTLEWLFSKETLRPIQANDADVRSTQLRVAAQLLGRLGHPSSREPLLELTKSKHHAVRWAAIQGLSSIDPLAAQQKIQDSLSDPHPHIQRAAIRTLDVIARKAEQALSPSSGHVQTAAVPTSSSS